MKKLSSLITSFLIPALAAALATTSCAGGETAGGSLGGKSGSGNTSGSGGKTGNGSGGSSFGTGGSTGNGSGGSTGNGSGGSSFGSGGSTGTSSGGASFGTGGSTGTASGGSTGTGTGGATVGGALTVVDGYGTSGTWMGYAYTFTGPAAGSKATVAPATFAAMTSLCATGMITADTTYASVAGMGWNINQAKGTTATSPPVDVTASSGAGLVINVTATGLTLAQGSGSQLRAQVKTATADFCAPIAASGTSTIPWAMFNSTCWNTTGMAFVAGTPIKAVELVIPSAAAATIGPFNICLLDAHPS